MKWYYKEVKIYMYVHHERKCPQAKHHPINNYLLWSVFLYFPSFRVKRCVVLTPYTRRVFSSWVVKQNIPSIISHSFPVPHATHPLGIMPRGQGLSIIVQYFNSENLTDSQGYKQYRYSDRHVLYNKEFHSPCKFALEKFDISLIVIRSSVFPELVYFAWAGSS